MSECYDCAKAWRTCRAKRRFDSEAVHIEAQRLNIETEWIKMLAAYRCPYCQHWHLTKSIPGTPRWKRVEKQRRKWVVARHLRMSA